MDFVNLVDIYLKYFADSTSSLTNYSALLAKYEDKLVLDCAVGTGSLTLDMLERGYQIHCSDASSEMLAAFRRNAVAKGLQVEPEQLLWAELGDRYPQRYDLILCKGNSLSYLNMWSEERFDSCPAELKNNLSSMFHALGEGGALYIDFPKPPKLERLIVDYPLKSLSAEKVFLSEEIETCFKKGQRRWLVNLNVNGEEYTFTRFSRYLNKSDLLHCLLQVGFTSVEDTMNVDDRDHYEALIAYK